MLGGGRTQGKVAAQYDEFFFNAPDDPDGTVRHKDFASTPDGMTFLRQTETAQANTWYETSNGGKRIIYEPAQTHPWNHFSKHTTAYAVEFYTDAFKENNQNLNQIDANSQVWQLKEVFECVALVGFVFFIIGFASLLNELPFFNKVKTELNPLPSIERTGSKIGIFALLLCLILVPGVFFSALMDGGAEMLGVMFLVDLTFKSDFRIWTFAFKTFDFNIIFPTIFRYFPTFLAYYVVSTASITIITNTEKMQGFKGYLLAIALNAGGGFLWLVHQYGMLFTTGRCSTSRFGAFGHCTGLHDPYAVDRGNHLAQSVQEDRKHLAARCTQCASGDHDDDCKHDGRVQISVKDRTSSRSIGRRSFLLRINMLYSTQ